MAARAASFSIRRHGRPAARPISDRCCFPVRKRGQLDRVSCPLAPPGRGKDRLPIEQALGSMHPGMRAHDVRDLCRHRHGLNHDSDTDDGGSRGQAAGHRAQASHRSLLCAPPGLADHLLGRS
jgi:hypothetical protein